MTIREWNDVVKTLNVMYEDSGHVMFETAEKIQVWYSCLNDLDYKTLCMAIKRYALRSKYRPTIADIRSEYVAVINGTNDLPESQAWALVRIALRDSTYHAEEQFAELPLIVQKALVTPDRLKEWAQIPSDTVGTVVRAEFRKAYESAVSQKAEAQKLGAIGLQMAQDIANKLTMKDD